MLRGLIELPFPCEKLEDGLSSVKLNMPICFCFCFCCLYGTETPEGEIAMIMELYQKKGI